MEVKGSKKARGESWNSNYSSLIPLENEYYCIVTGTKHATAFIAPSLPTFDDNNYNTVRPNRARKSILWLLYETVIKFYVCTLLCRSLWITCCKLFPPLFHSLPLSFFADTRSFDTTLIDIWTHGSTQQHQACFGCRKILSKIFYVFVDSVDVYSWNQQESFKDSPFSMFFCLSTTHQTTIRKTHKNGPTMFANT